MPGKTQTDRVTYADAQYDTRVECGWYIWWLQVRTGKYHVFYSNLCFAGQASTFNSHALFKLCKFNLVLPIQLPSIRCSFVRLDRRHVWQDRFGCNNNVCGTPWWKLGCNHSLRILYMFLICFCSCRNRWAPKGWWLTPLFSCLAWNGACCLVSCLVVVGIGVFLCSGVFLSTFRLRRTFARGKHVQFLHVWGVGHFGCSSLRCSGHGDQQLGHVGNDVRPAKQPNQPKTTECNLFLGSSFAGLATSGRGAQVDQSFQRLTQLWNFGKSLHWQCSQETWPNWLQG